MDNKIPFERLNYRPMTLEDIPQVVGLMNSHTQTLIKSDIFTIEQAQKEYSDPKLNLETDTQLAFGETGALIGYVDLFDTKSTHTMMNSWISVLPNRGGEALENGLIQWMKHRASQLMEKANPQHRVTLNIYILEQDTRLANALERHGFKVERGSYHMRIDVTSVPEIQPLPDTVSISTMQPGEEMDIILSVQDSFQDHWGWVPEAPEEMYKRWQNMYFGRPEFDPTIWFAARQNGKIVGVCLCAEKSPTDITMGWVNILGVSRTHRKRGVGTILLKTAFAELYRRGIPSIGLAVDSQNLTGATRLYEKAGMYVTKAFHMYEFEMRPGLEIATMGIDD